MELFGAQNIGDQNRRRNSARKGTIVALRGNASLAVDEGLGGRITRELIWKLNTSPRRTNECIGVFTTRTYV